MKLTVKTIQGYKIFNTDQGMIINFNQQDAFMYNSKRIDVLPAWKFLTDEPGH